MTRRCHVLAVAVAVLALAGCSTAVAGSAAPADTAAAATSAVPSPAATVAPPSDQGTAPSLDEAADGLRPFLLVPSEVGPGWTAGEEPQPDPATPAICGGRGTVAQFPYAVRVGAAFDGPEPGFLVQQTVSVYPDSDTAQVAFQATRDGLACSQGTVSGMSVVVTPAEDLRADLGGLQATGWRVGGDAFDVLLIAVQDDAIVMNFTYLTPVDRAGELPDPLVISRTGLQKLVG